MSTARRPPLTLLPLIVATVAPAFAVTLEDPTNFQVKNTFSAASLGLPGPLGGLLFSADGGVLYVVGASESTRSALYAVPVARNPATNEVTALGPAASVTKVFDGNPATPGLDAGFDFGPAGTLFYTYWSSNRLGQRPGGIAGAETQFDMATVGVPTSIAGLTFSPHRVDPATGFGRMQISSWSGANLYEVPLAPAGGGIYTPGQVSLFVTLPRQGTGSIQYVPSGPLAGNLMYVNYNVGEVRLLTIDRATGLPVDRLTGQPALGTTTPTDTRFASDVGGAWGLEFDPRTNDFFLATFNGDPANTIIQIGGRGFPPPTTTTTGVATTTTTTTTTTTMPACGNGRVDAAAGEQCDVGPANGAPGSCCDASCRLLPAGAVCRAASAACDQDATCDGAGASCPANAKKADADLCDDGNPDTGTSACRSDVCEGVHVSVQIPAELDVAAGTNLKRVGVPVTIAITGESGRAALVVAQGVADCGAVPPPPADCTTRTCRLIRNQLARSCGATAAATTLGAGRRRTPGKLVVTGTFTKKFGRSRSAAQGQLRLNKLGRSLLQQNAALPLEARAEIRDRGGSVLTALFRTLLRVR